ncbi:L,D-transpeptidase family protein [Corynebacterium phocae]|nr:Ig-like domain-containing protein [Corynebacterium phocae]KAA8726535.1 L,D-transpeptidase family protein [Corynebacterium phocae]
MRHRLIFPSALLALVTLSACSAASDLAVVGDKEAHAEAAQSKETATAAKPSHPPVVSVKDGAQDVDVDTVVKVTSKGEGLAEVTMTNEEGYEVESELSADGMEWETAEVLGMWRTYTVEATDKNGKTTTSTFTTISPQSTTGVALGPLADSTVGVGQTISFRFAAPVQDRQAAQDAMTVETTPHVEGAFYWISPYEIRWRPEEYWEPGTKVKVSADIYGKDLGGGMYGDADNETNFEIGDRVIAIVDDNTKMMEVWKNQQLQRTIPVSLGRNEARWATPNGRYIIGDQHASLVMDSMSYGFAYEDGGYKTEVDYATQMSYSGIYVHAAPWSLWAQGNTNTSHGCINVSTADAQWFQQFVKRGDIVYVKNTVGGTLPGDEGLGDWNMPWEQWSKGNADA